MSRRGQDRFCLAAFGLTVDSDWPLPGARRTSSAVAGSPLTTRVERMAEDDLDALTEVPGEVLQDLRTRDGRGRFIIHRTDQAFVLRLERFGRYVCSLDGRVVGCERDGAPRAAQERFLLAHVLPLAALLQGRQLLHAAAVAGTRGAAAFLGGSGAGKTTLVSHLVARGETFFTDDVLAIDSAAESPVAHPGPPLMAVAVRDRSIIARAGGRLGEAPVTTDKVHARPAVAAASVPLRAIYHIVPHRDFRISRHEGSGARQLLSGFFAPYVMDRERLTGSLAFLQRLEMSIPQFKLSVPHNTTMAAAVDALRDHLRELIH